jgi:Tfp pilus assembly protein FimT
MLVQDSRAEAVKMSLNVPYQPIQPVTSLSDAVGKWTTINNQQAQGQLAQQQETRLQNQNERENKMGDLKYNMTQQDALKSVMTDVKAKVLTQAQKLGIAEGTPQFQQLVDATYNNVADSTVQNITGKAQEKGKPVSWEHINALAGMTPQEVQQQDIQQEVAKSNALLPNKIAVAEAMSGISSKQDERNYEQARESQLLGFAHQDQQAQNQAQNDLSLPAH